MKLSNIPKKRLRIFAGIGVVLLCVGIYMLIHRGEESTDDAAFDARVVTFSSKVSGYVAVLHVNDNQLVKAGDVLVEIEPTDYIIRRDHAKAALTAAEARYAASGHALETTRISAPSSLEAAKAQVDAAQANWERAAKDLKRLQNITTIARTRQQLDVAVADEKSMRSALQDAKARLRSAETAPKAVAEAESTTDVTAAEIVQAQADLAQAEKDLKDTKILAPMDGRITERNVEQGNFVQPGQQLFSLVSATEVWVVANFKETQLKHMRTGQKVDIHVDAFPNLDMTGKVESFQYGTGARFSAFPPENATGNFVKIVQRVPVKITLDTPPDGNLPLGPGLSVVPTVYTR